MIAALIALLAVVNSPVNSVTYACDGTTAAYTVNFPYLSSGDLVVTSTTVGGVVTTLTLGVDYTLNVSSTSSTASLALNSPAAKCPVGSTFKIARNTGPTQPTSFRQQNTYAPSVHEQAFDRATMLIQEGLKGVTLPLSGAGTALSPLLMSQANATHSGFLSAADWSAFTAGPIGSNTYTAPFTGAVAQTVATALSRVVYVSDFGATGDGVTDDTAAIQRAVDAFAAYGVSQNAFALQPTRTLKFLAGKTYVITAQINTTYRNFLNIDFTGAALKWNGVADGRMFDCMGCNYLRVTGDLVNGNNLLGTFIRVSGGNTPGAGGKNNATGARFKGFDLRSMNAAGAKPWVQTTNDTPVYGDYSLDDAEFEGVWFASPGYAAVELASSEIRFDRVEFISVTRGIIYRTGTTARLTHTVFSGVRYPHYVVQNAAVGEISNTDCYAEAINSAGPVEGAFLFVEVGGATTAVKSFSIRGGDYSQGAPADVTTTSDFLATNGAQASVYIDGPRWQTTTNGRINMGANGHAFIRKITLPSAYTDYMPEIVGSVVYERIGRGGEFQLSVPPIDSVTLTVNAAGADDYGALTFTTIAKALAMVDQLGATQTIIDVKSAQTISTRRYLSGELRITSSNASTLTFNEEIIVRAGGSLTIDTITVITGVVPYAVVNRGGEVFANTLTVNNGAGIYLVRHERGLSIFAAFTLQAGRLVDASFTNGAGVVQINGGNTYTSAETVVSKGGSPIDVNIDSSASAAPGTGTWDVGTRVLNHTPLAAGFVGAVCTAAGTPGTWKTFGAISP